MGRVTCTSSFSFMSVRGSAEDPFLPPCVRLLRHRLEGLDG